MNKLGFEAICPEVIHKDKHKACLPTSYRSLRCCGVSLSWSWGGKGFETENYGEEESTGTGGANGPEGRPLAFASTLIALSNETCAPSQEDAVCP